MPGALLLALVSPAAAQEGILLRFTPPVGQVSVYHSRTETEVTMGTDTTASMVQEMWMTQEVTSVEDGIVTLHGSVDSVRAPGGPGIPGFNLDDRLTGLRSSMRIDARGRVAGMEVGDSALQQVMSGFLGQFGGGTPGQFLFPEGRVRPGETWSDTATTTFTMDRVRMEMFQDVTYRLERLEARGRARVAVLAITGAFRQRMDMEVPGQEMTLQFEGALSGEVAFDLDASRWVYNEMVMTMTGESAVFRGPVRMTATSRGELVED